MDKIIWCDVETTNLTPHENNGQLLQVAVFVTDNHLNLLDETGYEAVIQFTPENAHKAYLSSNEYVQNMHTKTGLWNKLTDSNSKPLQKVEQELLGYVKQFQPEPQKAWFGGNSIKLDRDFLSFYMPKFYDHFHYRSIDVTSVAGLVNAWYGDTFTKKQTHNAKDDIIESINELKYYQNKMLYNK